MGKQRLWDNAIIQTQTMGVLSKVSYYVIKLYRVQDREEQKMEKRWWLPLDGEQNEQ